MLVVKRITQLSFVEKDQKTYASFIVPDYDKEFGSLGIPAEIEIMPEEKEGIKAHPKFVYTTYKGNRVGVKLGPNYLKGLSKLPLIRRLLVRYKCRNN